MRLLRVELTRLRWRRAVLLLVTASLLVPALIFAATAWNTRPHSPQDLAQAEAEIARMEQDELFARDLADCTENPQNWGILAAEDFEAACRDMMLPSPEEWLSRPGLDLEQEIAGTGTGVVALLCALLLLVGTTFVGHDWNTRSMSNQLLFEPRRLRLWLAKSAAVLVVGLVVSAVVLTAYWTGLTLLAESRDLPHGVAVMAEVRGQVVRGTLLGGLAALTGYALTNLFRSTVATLGVVFVVTVAGGFLLGVLGGGADVTPWMPHTNLWAVVQGGLTYFVEDPVCFQPGAVEDCGVRQLSVAHASTYLGTLFAAIAGVSLWSYRRRDIP